MPLSGRSTLLCRCLATGLLPLVASFAVAADAARDAIRVKDFASAASMLAADTSPEARYLLAGLYARGQGVPRDTERALALYREAADAGYAAALVALEQEWASTSLAEVDGLTADDALRVAAARGSVDDIVELINAGADVNAAGTGGRTALHEAAELGGDEALVALLVAGADPNAVDTSSETALMKATRVGDALSVDALLDDGASLAATDRFGNTALHLAARYERLTIAERLIAAGSPLDASNERGMSALTIAMRRDDRRIARALRRAGATTPQQFAQVSLHTLRTVGRNINGREVWFIAAERGALPTLRREHTAGARLDARNGESLTALMMASARGYSDVVAWLLDAGASVAVADDSGQTAFAHAALAGAADTLEQLLVHTQGEVPDGGERLLHLAAASGDADTVSVALMATGATLPSRNGDRSALMVAAANGDHAVAARLLDGGVLVDVRDRQRRTALWYAADAGHADLVDLLIAAGADIDAADRAAITPLHRASERGHVDAVRRLLARGAATDKENARGYTPLLAALEARRYGVIEILAREKVDLDRRNAFGQTALILAAFRNDANAVTTLLAFGADAGVVGGNRRNAADVAEKLGNDAALAALRQR